MTGRNRVELPPLDHVGWGRLLSAVMQTDPIATGAPVQRPPDGVDVERLERGIELARRTVHVSDRDVYA